MNERKDVSGIAKEVQMYFESTGVQSLDADETKSRFGLTRREALAVFNELSDANLVRMKIGRRGKKTRIIYLKATFELQNELPQQNEAPAHQDAGTVGEQSTSSSEAIAFEHLDTILNKTVKDASLDDLLIACRLLHGKSVIEILNQIAKQ